MIEGFSHFVTSMTAPIASGWSIFAGWDFHPLESAAFHGAPPETPNLPTEYPLKSALTTCLWFDKEAEEALQFYAALLPNSRMGAVQRHAADSP